MSGSERCALTDCDKESVNPAALVSQLLVAGWLVDAPSAVVSWALSSAAPHWIRWVARSLMRRSSGSIRRGNRNAVSEEERAAGADAAAIEPITYATPLADGSYSDFGSVVRKRASDGLDFLADAGSAHLIEQPSTSHLAGVAQRLRGSKWTSSCS